MNYIKINTAGKVVGHGICQDEAVHLVALHNEEQLVQNVTPPSDWQRRFLMYQEGAIHDMGAPPSPHHEFNYTTKQWALDLSAAWRAVRRQRDPLLTASDWTQLSDAPPATKAIWVTYRRALRDVTQQADPLAIAWPEPP